MNSRNFTKLLSVTLILAFFIAACASPQKMINSGNYDGAINMCVKKLRKKKTKEKYVLLLHDAYNKARTRDLEKIDYLRREGRKDNSVQIYDIYKHIERRQALVRPLMPLYADGSEVDFKFLNIKDQLAEVKKEAAEFLYNKAKTLINKKDRFSSRQAYYQLLRLKEMYPFYKNTEDYIDKAYDRGMTKARFRVANSSLNLVPKDFVEELYAVNFQEAEAEWLRVYTNGTKGFDFTIDLDIKTVEVSPERVSEKSYEDKKEIQDGWEYEKESSGKYKTDTAGNKIKKYTYKTITATVNEMNQSKTAYIQGNIEIRKVSNNKLMRTEPIRVEMVFNHSSANYSGDMKALSPSSKQKMKNKAIPFPTDQQMILDGAQKAKPIIVDVIRKSHGLMEGLYTGER